MRKVMAAVAAGIVIVAGMFLSGCTITPEQSKAIAQNAGIYSAVIWISVDNPTALQIAEVKTVLDVINEKAKDVKAGQTFTEVIYPELVKVIDIKLPVSDRPLAKAASLTILNGLDTLFAMHPEWTATSGLILDIVNAYVTGAKLGLGMDEKNPVMIQARSNASARARLFVK